MTGPPMRQPLPPARRDLDARGTGLTLLALSAFAANSLLCRAALGPRSIDAASFTLVRLAAGALVLGLLARARGATASSGAWGRAACLFGYALPFSLAYTRIPAAVGALALFGAVQVTMVGHGWATGERPRPAEWAGLVLSLGGLVGLLLPGLHSPDPLGTSLMLLAGVAWGGYSVQGRRVGDALSANAAAFVRSVPLALLTSLAAGVTLAPPRLGAQGLGLALASGALASGLGYAVWYAALRHLSAAQAAVAQLAVPPLTALGGALLLGERLDARVLLCGTAILAGIGLALTARSQAPGIDR